MDDEIARGTDPADRMIVSRDRARAGRGDVHPCRLSRHLAPRRDQRAPGSLYTVLFAGILAFGLVLAVAAIFVIREAGRIANEPPPALFDPDDAYGFVVEELPDNVAATLTPDDVRRMLNFEVEFLKRSGGNNPGTDLDRPLVFDGSETTAYILERASATGEAYLSEQVQAVVETQLRYLRAIGAIRPAT
jgi:hypothetical protein